MACVVQESVSRHLSFEHEQVSVVIGKHYVISFQEVRLLLVCRCMMTHA